MHEKPANEYLAECFWPGVQDPDLQALDERAATVTAELNVRYRHPVPMGQTLRAKARLVDSKEDRVFNTSGELLLPDGSVAASATGVFVVPKGGTFTG